MAELDLSAEEGNRLIYYFIAECALSSSQAMADVMDPNEMAKLSSIIAEIASKAYVLNRSKENRFAGLLNNEDPLLTIGVHLQHYYRTSLGCKFKDMIITDRSLVFSISDVQPPDMTLEGKRYVCVNLPSAMVTVIDPQCELLWGIGESTGSKDDRILVRSKGDTATTIGDEGTPRLCILPLRISHGEMDFWRRHFYGESWRHNSNALIDGFGMEGASKIVEPYMKQMGRFYGDYLRNRFELKGQSPLEVGEIVFLLNRLLKQEIKAVRKETDMMLCDITSCPFANTSPLICRQMGMILEGICQAINDDVVFEYYAGLTEGGGCCSWSVSRRPP